MRLTMRRLDSLQERPGSGLTDRVPTAGNSTAERMADRPATPGPIMARRRAIATA
jgi:hypothetical protein